VPAKITKNGHQTEGKMKLRNIDNHY